MIILQTSSSSISVLHTRSRIILGKSEPNSHVILSISKPRLIEWKRSITPSFDSSVGKSPLLPSDLDSGVMVASFCLPQRQQLNIGQSKDKKPFSVFLVIVAVNGWIYTRVKHGEDNSKVMEGGFQFHDVVRGEYVEHLIRKPTHC